MNTKTETTEQRHRRLYERPLARIHALAEGWTGDHTPITRDQAARLILEYLDPHAWTETDQAPPRLASVPEDRP